MQNSEPFQSDYERFIYKSRYARWLETEQRRENLNETVSRYINFMEGHLSEKHGYELASEVRDELFTAIHNLEVVPSMRALMTAGPALARDNTCGFNCSYLVVDDPKAFDEAMYILLCGTGVGFSVERQYIQKLPEVPDTLYESDTKIVVADSKAGWAKAYRQLLALLWSGEIPKWDTSKVRPAGARLKVFGGRASGPGPLIDLFEFTIATFKKAVGRKLTSIECHDLMCKIGFVVVSGGVRRSAMLSLSNLTDQRMAKAKSGSWWEQNGQRALANNSVAYTEKPDVGAFMAEWTALYESKSGERGIFNRAAAEKQVLKNGRREGGHDWGCNPCSEILLRPYQFCNLSEVVVRSDDTEETLAKKVRAATILGTIQSSLTNFPYLRKIWQRNTEEECLLGVSLTGIMDSALMNGKTEGLPELLERLKQVAIDTNAEFADAIGINRSTAICAVKPSGTVSQLVNAASGIHARHSPFYIRSVRGANTDPITQFMKEAGIPNEPDVTNPERTTVFFFPIESPADSVTRNDMTAIEQLELWKVYQDHWCEQKPSVTISVREHEWPAVGGWVYDNFDCISGISFLPHSEHSYKQAPYEECSEEKYLEMKAKMPSSIDWTALQLFEFEDATTGSSTLACGAGGCEDVDVAA